VSKPLENRAKFFSLITDRKLYDCLNQTVPILLGIFIFMNPFPATTIKEISFYSSVLIVLVLLVSKKNILSVKTPMGFSLIIFALWSFLSIFWALNVENTIHDFRAHLLKHIVLFFLLINFFNSRKRFYILVSIFMISVTLFSLTAMVNFYVIQGNPITKRFGITFTEVPINFIGSITITAMIIGLNILYQEHNKFRRMLFVACLITIFTATILTQSRGTLIAMIIAIACELFIKNKKIILVFFLIIVGFLMINFFQQRLLSFKSLTERIRINYLTFEVIKDYPVTGIGFGMQTFVQNIKQKDYLNRIPKKYLPVNVRSTHNIFLSIAVRLGIVGLLLFLNILFVFGKLSCHVVIQAKDDFIKNWGYATINIFVAYLIIGILEPLFLFHASAIVFYLIISMITILWQINEQEIT